VFGADESGHRYTQPVFADLEPHCFTMEVHSTPSLNGDINLDGVISIDDVSVLLSHVLGNIHLTGQALLNADVNGDGVISIDDISTLLYISMSK
jgi:hypothetical protein